MKNRINGGFTLIEVMIVVAIIGILAAIAYPSYMESVLKGRRAEGRAALAELLQQQERYMTQRNVYLSFTNASGTTNPATVPFKTFSGDSAANPAYFLQAFACSATISLAECVMVEAVPVRSDLRAGKLQVWSTGVKTCSGGTDPSVCWK